jgi:hypothetical protein
MGLEEPAAIDLSPTGRSEFQEPSAAEELRLSGTAASEYQSTSGADELLKSVESGALLAPAPSYLEPPPPPPLDVPTSGFAAITLMPTEELPTTASPEVSAPLQAEREPAPAQSVIEMLAAASTTPPASPPVSAKPDLEPEAVSAGANDLHLIFPDEAAEPEPPRMRRITEEIVAMGERKSAETPGEPAPVVTETMAELYARQGHLAEALNVYRILAARTPNDPRLAQRICDLEAAQSAGGRRMSYVAVDTGGESVESFFRSLSDARPAGPGEPVHEGDDSGGGAPTRPASDALSLSAIFGEDTSAAASTSVGEPPARPGNPDSFSFDQFFGGSGAAPSSTGPRQAMPTDEDLDQFQNWLKSLKR